MKNNPLPSPLRAWSCALFTLALCAAQACGPNGECTLRMNAPEDQKRQPSASKQPIVSMLPDSAPTGGSTSTKHLSARGKRKGYPTSPVHLPLHKHLRRGRREQGGYLRYASYLSPDFSYPLLPFCYGFKAKAIEADGNCLFRAVADQLISRLGITFPTHTAPYMVLKHIAADHVQRHPQLYPPALPYTSVAQLATALRQEGEWGGDEALSALSRALQLPIVVVQDQCTPSIHIYKPFYAQRRAIYLYYTDRVHYESLYEETTTPARQVVARQLYTQPSDEDFTPAALPNIQSTVNEIAGRMATVVDSVAKHTEHASIILNQRLQAHYQTRYAAAYSPFDSAIAYPMQQIEPQLAVVAPAHDIHHKHTVTLGSLFWRQSTDEVPVRVRNVLLIGQAGIGKTTLTHKLAYLWATGQWEEDTFESVYVLPVAKLHRACYDGKSLRTRPTLATAIARECYRAAALSDDEFIQLTEAITYQLRHYPGKVLLIVDGLEQRHEASEAILQQLEQCAPQTYQLRTAHCDEVSDAQKALMSGRDGVVIACNTMTRLQRNHYVEHYFQDADAKASSALLCFLKQRSALSRLSLTPSHLQLLCFLWQQDDKAVIRETRQGSLTGLYRLLAQCVLRDYATQGASSAEAIQKVQALYQQTVEQLALFEFSQDKPWNLYTGGNLETMLQEVKVCKEFLMTDCRLYDYFLGSALARMFLDEKKRSEVMRFLQASKYQKQYQQILTLMAGMLYEQEGAVGLAQLLKTFDKGTRQEAIGLQHLLLQLRCVNECIGLAKNEEAVKSLQAHYASLTDQLYDWAQQGLAQLRSRSTDSQLHQTLLQAFAELDHVVANSKLFGLYTAVLQDAAANTSSLAALRALAVLAPASPKLAQEAIQLFLAMSENAPPPLRTRGIVALGTLVNHVPDCAQEIFRVLLRLLLRNDSMKSTIDRACVKLMAAAPAQEALAMQKALLQMPMPDDDIALRIREIFSDLVKTKPSDALYHLLLQHCASPRAHLQTMAIQALGALVRVWPHCAGHIAQTILAPRQGAAYRSYPYTLEMLETLEDCAVAAARAHKSQAGLQGDEQSTKVNAERVQPLPLALSEQIWAVALSASTDTDSLLQERAADMLEVLAGYMSPQLAAHVLPGVMAMAQHHDAGIRILASWILPKLAKVHPEHILPCTLPVLIKAYNAPNPLIRAASIIAITGCLEIDNACVLPWIWPTLCQAAQDNAPAVQRLAIATFKDIATTVPEACVQPICERLLQQAKHTAAPDTCIEALGALEEYIAVMEKRAGKALLEVLLVICRDSDECVRRAAIHTLSVLANSVPTYVPAVLPVFIQACRQDSAPAVRCHGLRALEQSAAIASHQASFEAVISACTDPSPLVRAAAGKALQQIHKKATPHVMQALRPLLIMSMDKDRSVQANAHNALMRYSTRYFIEQYCQYSILQNRLLPCALWRTVHAYAGPPLVHELCLAHIRTRLQRMPLVIKNRQLTLYPSASRCITWSMPEAEVEVLRDAVRGRKSKDGEST